MPVVGGQHEESVAFVVGEVCGNTGGEVSGEGGCVAIPSLVEELCGELDGFRGEGGGIGGGLWRGRRLFLWEAHSLVVVTVKETTKKTM